MTTYTVSQNTHAFKPRIFKFHYRPGRLDFEAVFNASCLYAPIDEEHDWNKLIGRAFDPVNQHQNNFSCLAVYRLRKL